MPAPSLPLRPDYDGPMLRRLALTTRGFDIQRRLLAIAAIYEGNSRTYAAQTGGVSLQSLRTWVIRFNAGGPDALRNNYNLSAASGRRDSDLEHYRLSPTYSEKEI